MPITQSPLAYFGNRSKTQNELFQLIESKVKEEGRFQNFYDIFSGSGAMTLYAMSLDLAESYYLNDLFSPLAAFWKAVKDQPEELISEYQSYLKDYLESKNQKQYYQELLIQYNQSPNTQSALFAFIINHANNGIPLISEKDKQFNLQCQVNESKEALECDTLFPSRISEVHELFNKHNVYFSSKDFLDYTADAKPNDFFLLDPPYPDMKDANEAPDSHVYQRNQSTEILTNHLSQAIDHLNQNHCHFVLSYGVLGLKSPYQLMKPDNHLYHLIGHPQDPFNEFIEHVFVSNTLVPYVTKMSGNYRLQPRFHRIFETHSYQGNQKNGDKTALSWNSSGIQREATYSQLNKAANKLARYFWKNADAENPRENLLAIYLERQPNLIVSLLASLKSGIPYLPIDANPNVISRAACLKNIKQSNAAYLITTKNLLLELKKVKEYTQILNNIKIIVVPDNDPLCLNLTKDIQDDSNLQIDISENDLAYVMYTSGSTGDPKGVEITHKGLPFVLSSHQNLLNVGIKDRVLQYGSIAFDASLMEIILALGSGASLYLLTKEIHGDIPLLSNYIIEKKITLAIITPKVLSILNPKQFPDLKRIFIVGDAFKKALSDKWLETKTDNGLIQRTVINGYGITETTICTTLGLCHLDKPLSIGKAVLGLDVFLRPVEEVLEAKVELGKSTWLKPPILSKEFKPQEAVLYASGPMLARGYWKNPSLTTDVFYETEINSKKVRLYNTKDVGYFFPDGSLAITGRIDRQEKIRGQRINLDQVEEILLQMKAVISDVRAVIYTPPSQDNDTSPEKMLIIYIVPHDKSLIIEGLEVKDFVFEKLIEVRQFIQDRASSSMVPSVYCMKFIEKLPRNSAAKNSCDDKFLRSLPVPCIRIPAQHNNQLQGFSEGINAAIKKIREIIAAILNIPAENIGYHEQNIYELGADSLKIHQCVARIHNEVKSEDLPDELIKSITATELASSNLYDLGMLLEARLKKIKAKQIEQNEITYSFGIASEKRLLSSIFNLSSNTFLKRASIPFYVVHSILGDASMDYESSIIQQLSTTHQVINTPKIKVMNQWNEKDFMDSLVDFHIQNLKKQEGESEGVYWLLGWSTGGIVAMKMAKKLRKEGKTIYTFIIDAHEPKDLRMMDSKTHAEKLINMGNHILGIISKTFELYLPLKIRNANDIAETQDKKDQTNLLFKDIINQYHELCLESKTEMTTENQKSIPKLIESARKLYLSELYIEDEWTFNQDDNFYFASRSDAKLSWHAYELPSSETFESDHFDIMYSDQLKEAIESNLYYQYKLNVIDVAKAFVYINLQKYNLALVHLNSAIQKNPNNLRAHCIRAQLKLILKKNAEIIIDLATLFYSMKTDYMGQDMSHYKTLYTYYRYALINLEKENIISLSFRLNLEDIAHLESIDIDILRNKVFPRHEITPQITSERKKQEVLVQVQNNKLNVLDILVKDFKKSNMMSKPWFLPFQLGMQALIQNNNKNAIRCFTSILLINPKLGDAYAGLACAYLYQNDFDTAIQKLNQGISFDFNNRKLRTLRGFLRYLLEQYIAAVLDLNKVYKLYPHDNLALMFLSQIYLKTDFQKSIQYATEMIIHDPVSDIAYALLGYAYLKKGETDKALDSFTKAISIRPIAEHYFGRCRVYSYLRDDKRIIEEASHAIALNASNPEYFLVRANGYLIFGEYDKAIEDLKKCAQLELGMTPRIANSMKTTLAAKACNMPCSLIKQNRDSNFKKVFNESFIKSPDFISDYESSVDLLSRITSLTFTDYVRVKLNSTGMTYIDSYINLEVGIQVDKDKKIAYLPKSWLKELSLSALYDLSHNLGDFQNDKLIFQNYMKERPILKFCLKQTFFNHKNNAYEEKADNKKDKISSSNNHLDKISEIENLEDMFNFTLSI